MKTADRVNLYVALTEALAPTGTPTLTDAERATVTTDAAAFVRGQIDALPAVLGFLVKTGLTGFRVLVRLRYVRSFCALPLQRRRRIANWWAYGPIGLTRQLFRALRSTVMLGYYDHPIVAAKINEGRR